MLNEKWIPTQLIDHNERQQIPISDRKAAPELRQIRVGLHILQLGVKLLCLKIIGRLDHSTIGKLFRNFCQQNGVLWIKFGQLLSMRTDLFSDDLCAELAMLQDRVEGFSPAIAKEIVISELGREFEKCFSNFEDTPFAAASIAQVHRAYLKKERIWVAIKIRRPGIDQIFSQDMSLISVLFHLLTRVSIMPYMRWVNMLWELQQVFTEELDYRYEVSNHLRIRKKLARHQIYTPKVFRSFCTRNIIVMEYIDAVSMADYIQVLKSDRFKVGQWLRSNNIDTKEVGRKLLYSFLRQILEDNLFHADLHPGNIFLLRDNQIVFLDFGSVGCNERDMLRKYDTFLESLCTGQYAKGMDIFMMIMPDITSIKGLAAAKDELQRCLQSWGNRCRIRELPYNEKSTSFVFNELTRILAKHGVTLNWAFLKLFRGWSTLDTSFRELNPHVNLPALTRNYSKQRRNREFTKMVKHLPSTIMENQNIIDYPRKASEMISYSGEMIRRQSQVFEGTATRVSRLLSTIFGLGSVIHFLVAVAFGFIALFQNTSLINLPEHQLLAGIITKIPTLDTQVWLVILVLLAHSFLSLAFLARRFHKHE